MSQQNLDLRTSIMIVRRGKKLFSGVAALGVLAGAAYAFLSPPPLSATALVVATGGPATIANSAQTATSVATSMDTQIVIASSDAVLAGALPNVSPPSTSLEALSARISVAAVGTSDVLSITATGKTGGQAIGTANAVANSYVTYVSNPKNPAYVVAKVIEPAATASGARLPVHVGIYAIVGGVAGAIIGFVICLVLSRGNRRLVLRDDIANSIGVPVLASIPVERPADSPSWARLVEEYKPDVVHAYGLSKLLQQLGLADYNVARQGNMLSVAVLSLASDPAALAIGPQLAAFASAQGISTALIIGPQQDMNVTATLRTACAVERPAAAGQSKPLRLLVAKDGPIGNVRAAFSVIVQVIDGRDPRILTIPHTTATVLAVSAGGATAEELARAATAAAGDGRDIYGILVANPDPSDQTTGRIPRLTQTRRNLPTRVNGLVTEVRR